MSATPLPPQYAWLDKEPGPRLLLEARKLYGTVEVPGKRDSPIILGWARELGLERTYSHDSVAWCGLFAAIVARRADKPECPKNPLWALNWGLWGNDAGQPELGELLTFIRHYRDERGREKIGGHVGFYVGEDDLAYHVLGGNQSNAVTIARVAKDRLRACRSYYKNGKPDNVRPVFLHTSGEPLSDNEA
jgi:uncharacterized protein (TIGR02594 family)